MAYYPVQFIHTAFSVTPSTLEALAANDFRVYVLLENDSDTDIYVAFGVPAVVNQGIRLNANGGSLELSEGNHFLDVRAINAIHGGAGGKNLLITEG